MEYFNGINNLSLFDESAADFNWIREAVVTNLEKTTNSTGKERNSNKNYKASEICRFVKSENCVDGEITRTQLYLEKLYNQDKDVFRESFQKAWLSMFKNELEITNLLNVVSMMDYNLFGDFGDSMVVGTFSHESCLVREASVKVIESWEQSNFVEYLESMKPFEEQWLEDYRQEVLDILKG